MNNRVLLKSVIVLVVICLATSGALAVVNSFTAPVISAAEQQRETESRQALIPEAAEFRPLSLDRVPPTVKSADLGLDAQGNPLGYVFKVHGKGFNGTIVVMVAIDLEGKILRVSTMDVTSETATLGGQTAKESYTSQYAGADESLEGVSAISGATITSDGYKQSVLDCFAAFQAVKEAE